MKRLLILAFLLCPSLGWSAIAFSHVSAAGGTATSGTIAATVTINAGDTVVVGVIVNASVTRTITMVDSASNAGYAQQTFADTNSHADQVYIWGACNVGSNATSVTVTVSGTYTRTTVDVATYTGVGTNCFGNTNTSTSTSASTLTVAVTTQDSNNFVAAAMTQHAATQPTLSASVGNLRGQAAGGTIDVVGMNDNTAAGAGSVTNTVTSNKTSGEACAAVELRSTNASGVVRHRAEVIQ